MPELIYDHEEGNRGLASKIHPLFRDSPAYVGAPDALPSELRHEHVLRIAVLQADERLPTRIERRDLLGVGSRLTHLSILKGLDFYRQWVLLHGSPAAFDDAGILVLDRQPSTFGRLTLVAGPERLPVRSRSTGDSSYGPTVHVALATLGAQLYLCEKIGLGVEGPEGSALTAKVTERLSEMLAPLKSCLRSCDTGESIEASRDLRSQKGETGHGDPLYRDLLRRGTPLVLERFPGRPGKSAIGRRLRDIGTDLPPVPGEALPFAQEQAEEGVRAAVDWACLALSRDKALRQVRSVGAGDPVDARDGEHFRINVPAAEALVEPGARELPNIFALTRLACLWDVTPADDYLGLFPWRLHFAAARFVGRLHRGDADEVELDAEAHWGLRAIRYDTLDGSLDSGTRQARAWLRRYMAFDEDFWATKPRPMETASVRPAWRHVPVRKARRGTP